MKRTIKKLAINATLTLRLRRDAEWNEYRVERLNDGVLDEGATYFTDAKDDALATFDAEARRLREHEEKVMSQRRPYVRRYCTHPNLALCDCDWCRSVSAECRALEAEFDDNIEVRKTPSGFSAYTVTVADVENGPCADDIPDLIGTSETLDGLRKLVHGDDREEAHAIANPISPALHDIPATCPLCGDAITRVGPRFVPAVEDVCINRQWTAAHSSCVAVRRNGGKFKPSANAVRAWARRNDPQAYTASTSKYRSVVFVSFDVSGYGGDWLSVLHDLHHGTNAMYRSADEQQTWEALLKDAQRTFEEVR